MKGSLSGWYPSNRVFFNVLGASLTLLSLQLSWASFYGLYSIFVQSTGIYAIAFYWALAGAILSFLSRYGGIMTLVGVLGMFVEPYAYYGLAGTGVGILVAVFGAFLTLAGSRWTVPGGLRRREVLGGILYSIGFLIVLGLLISSVLYAGTFALGQIVDSAPLFLVGAFLTGVGLKLFLSPERERANSLTVLPDRA